MRRNDRQIYYSSGEASSFVVVEYRLLDEEKGEARMDEDKTGIREIINYRKGECIATAECRIDFKKNQSFLPLLTGSTGC